MPDPIIDPYLPDASQQGPHDVPALVPAPQHRAPRSRLALVLVTGSAVACAGVGAALLMLLPGDPSNVSDTATTQQATGPRPAQTLAPVGTPPRVGRSDLTDDEQHTVGLFRQAAPSVVYITRITIQHHPLNLNANAIPSGTGSGFVWDDDGHVVTNFHVIREASAARVSLSDQSTWPAELVGTAPEKDIAVLKIKAPASKLEPLARGASTNLLVGQHVLAIGNPFGLDHTLSTGVISGLGREIQSLSGSPITGVIQTDAAINPGNSGGPLLDSRGRLIGINTAIFSPSGASAGIGFAVPVNTVKRIVPQLIEHGRVKRPGLGIQIADESVAARIGIEGVLVLGVVDGSGADKAGLRATKRDPRSGAIILGDVVVELEGTAIERPADLFRELDEHEVGDKVKITVMRGDKRVTVTLKLSDIGE